MGYLTLMKSNIWLSVRMIQTHHQFHNHWKDSWLMWFGLISKDFNQFRFSQVWDQVLNSNTWFGKSGTRNKEFNNSVNCQNLIRISGNSKNCYCIELWGLIEYHPPSTAMCQKWWIKDTLNNRHLTFSKPLSRLIREFQYSLCYSPVLIRPHKFKELLLNMEFRLQTKSSQILVWVKVSKSQPKTPYSIQQRKDIGSCSKTCI